MEYIKSLLKPLGKSQSERKAWALGVDTFWKPVLTCANMEGTTSIPKDVLGQPLRLSKDSEGQVRFGKDGTPSLKLHKEFAGAVNTMRENFAASVLAEAKAKIASDPKAYGAYATECQQAGLPIRASMVNDVQATLNLIAAQEAAAKATEAAIRAPIEAEPVPA